MANIIIIITDPQENSQKAQFKPISNSVQDFPKLDASFVEHGSAMRGAIPVLPVPLAWICLILNVFLPGFGEYIL